MAEHPEDIPGAGFPEGWRVFESVAVQAVHRRRSRPALPPRSLLARGKGSTRLRNVRKIAPRIRQLERECWDFLRTATEEELLSKIQEGLSELALMRAMAVGINPDG
jgi:hypothetical protein